MTNRYKKNMDIIVIIKMLGPIFTKDDNQLHDNLQI